MSLVIQDLEFVFHRSLSAEKCKPFLEVVLQQRTAQDVMNHLRTTYGEIFSERLYAEGG